MVSEGREAALNTGERSLIGTIRFIDVTAAGTGATRVARVNRDHEHTSALGLVFDEGSQLVKRPTVQDCSLPALSPDPLTDTAQFFEGNSRLPSRRGAFCGFYNLTADLVVDMLGKVALLAGKLLEPTLGCFRAFLLKLGTQTPVTVAHVVDSFAGVDSGVRINCDIDHAKVNAKELSGAL